MKKLSLALVAVVTAINSLPASAEDYGGIEKIQKFIGRNDVVVSAQDIESRGWRQTKLAEERQPWSSTYWPSNFGEAAYPYATSGSKPIIPLFWDFKKGYFNSRIEMLRKRYNSFTQEELDQLAPAEKYDLLMGDAKDSIVIQHNKLRTSEKIKSTVSNVSGDIKIEKTIEIPIYNPEIHWYIRNKFNYRRLQSVDNGLRVASGDTNLIAEPYFFSTTNSVNDLEFNWSINSESIYLDPNAPSQELLVRNPGTTGQANFRVSITNPATFLQSAGRAVSFFFQNNP
jgi:hypothetical protein